MLRPTAPTPPLLSLSLALSLSLSCRPGAGRPRRPSSARNTAWLRRGAWGPWSRPGLPHLPPSPRGRPTQSRRAAGPQLVGPRRCARVRPPCRANSAPRPGPCRGGPTDPSRAGPKASPPPRAGSCRGEGRSPNPSGQPTVRGPLHPCSQASPALPRARDALHKTPGAHAPPRPLPRLIRPESTDPLAPDPQVHRRVRKSSKVPTHPNRPQPRGQHPRAQ